MELLNKLKLKKIPNTYNEVIIDLSIKKEVIEKREINDDEDINYDEDDEDIDTTRFLKGVKKVIIEKDDYIEEENIEEEKDRDYNVEDEIINYVEEGEEEGEKEITSLASNLGKFFGVKSKESITDEKSHELYKIPLFSEHIRSINLANAVSVVVYEGIRKLGYSI